MRHLLPLFLLIAAGLALVFLLGRRDEFDTESIDDIRRSAPEEGRRAPGEEAPLAGATREQPDTSDRRTEPGVLEAEAPGIRGEVVDEGGRPVPGADVVLQALDPYTLRGGRPTSDAQELGRTTSDRDGRFLVALDAARWVRVTASAPTYATVGVAVPGPTARVRLRLPPAARLHVDVVTPDAKAVADARVEATVRDARHVAHTDAEGRAVFDALAPGAAAVAVSAEGLGEVRPPTVGVDAGTTAHVLVVLAPSAALSGRVVDVRTGEGVREAEVHVRAVGRTLAVGRTDSGGRFGPVAAGARGESILVAVRAPGFTPALSPFQLPDGDEPLDVEVSLWTGRPWRGRVLDGAGRPVGAAAVGYTADGIDDRPPEATVTDAEGRFELPPPPPPVPGRRVVLVAESPRGTAALALRPGDEAPEKELVLVLAGGARVSGRVVDDGGRPTSGLVVRLDPRWEQMTDRARPGPVTSRLLAMNERGRLALTTTVDEGGWWRIADVPDGAYGLRVLTPEGTRFGEDDVAVAGSDVVAGTLRLGTGSSLDGSVVDTAGRPIGGVDVRLLPAGERAWMRRVVSAADGAWRHADVAPGRYRLQASRHGFDEAHVEVEVPATEPPVLVLVAGARVTGRVTAGGRPHRGTFRVFLEPVTRRRGARRVERAFTSSTGRFEVEGVGEGEWRLSAEARGGGDIRVGTANGRLDVRPGASYDVTIELEGAAELAGRLLAADGKPARGGRVELRSEGSRRPLRLTADAGGRFRAAGLVPGTWRITAWGRGGSRITETTDVVAASTRDVELRLDPAASLTVRAVGPDGRPRAQAYVLPRPAPGTPPLHDHPYRTGADGRVRLEDLPLGALELTVRTTAGETGSATADVVAEGADEVVVTVAPRRSRGGSQGTTRRSR